MRLSIELGDETKAAQLLTKRFAVNHSPRDPSITRGLRRVHIDLEEGCVRLDAESAADTQEICLFVVDEAHHVHAAGELDKVVKEYAPKGSETRLRKSTRLILLSDVSQSGEDEMAEAHSTQAIRLEQVRCTLREGQVVF